MKAYLGIGTNIGDRLQNLKDAVSALRLLPMTRVTECSNIYETAPVGYENQQDFLNMVCEVETDLLAEVLLGAALGIEAALGRVRTIKNGPRVIDIDLLLYEKQTSNTESLVLPHPRMMERNFVLKPLLDLDFGDILDRNAVQSALTGTGVRFYCEKEKITE